MIIYRFSWIKPVVLLLLSACLYDLILSQLVPLIIVVDNQMMKFDKTSLRFLNYFNLCLALVYLEYNYSNWWLEAVQDEHKQKFCVV